MYCMKIYRKTIFNKEAIPYITESCYSLNILDYVSTRIGYAIDTSEVNFNAKSVLATKLCTFSIE